MRIAVLEAEAVAAGRVTRARASGGARPHAHAAVSVAMQAGGDAEGAQQAVEGVAGFGQQLGVVAAGGALFARLMLRICQGRAVRVDTVQTVGPEQLVQVNLFAEVTAGGAMKVREIL